MNDISSCLPVLWSTLRPDLVRASYIAMAGIPFAYFGTLSAEFRGWSRIGVALAFCAFYGVVMAALLVGFRAAGLA